MKTGALLVAAAALTGCATTPSPQFNSSDTAAESPRVDRCMWAKPRCRAK